MRCLLRMQDPTSSGRWLPSYGSSLNRNVGPRDQGIVVDRSRYETMEDTLLSSLFPEHQETKYRTTYPDHEVESHTVHQYQQAPQVTTDHPAGLSGILIMGAVVSLFHYYTTTLSATGENMSEKCDPNAALAQALRGQVIHIDSTNSFRKWPMGDKHPEYIRLQREADRLLEMAVPDPKRCKKFKKSDFALFASLWWPDAEWEDLYTAMLFTVCLFVWDDIIDTNEHELASDYERASVWREQSLAYFKYQLRLSPTDKGEPPCPEDVCLIFKEFGERFCKSFGDVQRRRMFSKIENFVEHNRLEQAERLAGRIPDYEQYMHIRYGVTGVRMFSLLLEIANKTTLPSWVMDSPEMDSIVQECNFIIIVVNDILSLKKEIATDCVVNAVPVLCKTGKSLQDVVAWLWDEMHASRDRLDALAAKLDSMTRSDPELNKNVLKYINGIRIMDTGTLVYSIESPRYGILQYLQEDGTLDIVL